MNTARSTPVALFISDLHLQASTPNTTQAFFSFLQRHAIQSQQLFLLGDLFEYWVGDDDIATPWIKEIVDAIRAVSDAGVEVNWIAGNRDFLVGENFAAATGVNILSDPFVTTIGGKKIVLTHGDILCTNDPAYMEFRADVRRPEAQQEFLALPLEQRRAIAEGMRADSMKAQQEKSVEEMDVSESAVKELFEQSGATEMIHGHTHRPWLHEYENETLNRHVLTDWDCECKPEIGGWLGIYGDGAVRRFDEQGRMITLLFER